MPSNLAIQAMGDYWGEEATGQDAYRRARSKPGRMANNLLYPHYFGLLASCDLAGGIHCHYLR
eukprot:1145575-Pelagomonas_calceolata.AAC.2